MLRNAVLLVALASLAGCTGRAPDASELAALVAVAPAVLSAHDGEVPPSQWPEAVRRFHPERVYAGDAGLYVVTGSFFVTERGVFVPRDPAAFAPDAGSDPAYAPLGRGVYVYRVEG